MRTLNSARHAAARWLFVTVVLIIIGTVSGRAALAERKFLPAMTPPVSARLTAPGALPGTNRIPLAIGLPLRNEGVLTNLFQQLYDPQSTNYHKFLSTQEFTDRFGPTEQDYQSVIQFAETNGLTVVRHYGNRLVLDVQGSVTNIERTFQTTLRTYRHPTEPRNFFAPDVAPSVPTNLPVRDVWGLSDYGRPQPLVRPLASAPVSPLNHGSGAHGAYEGADFRHAYVPGSSLRGSGQTVAVVEFDGYYPSDIAHYESLIGCTNVPLTDVLVDNVSGVPGFSGINNAVLEVSLDIELVVSMGPALSNVLVYEGASPFDVLAQIVSDDQASQISCSWFFGYGPTFDWTGSGGTLDSQLLEMGVQGQSFFQASGDSDAYGGAQAISSSTGPTPVDSIYVTSVGGTTLTMTGTGTSWSAESVWNSGSNMGSGGGISTNYTIPFWQTNVSMAADGGSAVYRNIPDVAMTADDVFVYYGYGGSTNVTGTSCAAPLWAGFCALANQQAAAFSHGTNVVGFLNPALYRIAAGAGYSDCFHDIVTGNNIGINTPGQFYATNGYDLCTGLGTPGGTNLINALVPPAQAYFISQPMSVLATNGGKFTLNPAVIGQAPLTYGWFLNGVAVDAANASVSLGGELTVTNCTVANAGNYYVVVTNSFSSITSSVVTVTVVGAPVLSSPLTNETVECGGDASFSVSSTSVPAPAFQWSEDGLPLPGATNATLTLADVHLPSHTVSVVLSNLYGNATNGATLVVQDTTPPLLTLNGASTIYVELGSAFMDPGATATDVCAGDVPVPVIGSVDTNSVGTNELIYEAADANGNSSSVTRVVIVHDTTPPAILWNFTNLVVAAGTDCGVAMPNVTGTNFIIATDLSGPPAITQIPSTNDILLLGTNMVILAATDTSGNVAYATNTIVVADETPPVIESEPQSQTNEAGDTVTFTVTASACTPLTYQWYFNETVFPGQTNDTLTLTNVSTANVGNYDVVVTAAGGSTTSSMSQLILTENAPLILSIAANPDGGFVLTAVGPPGGSCILQTTTCYSEPAWQALFTNDFSTGMTQFMDSETNDFRRFYRALLEP